MTTSMKIIAGIIAVLVLFGAGFGVATWRHRANLAGYNDRELQRMNQIAVKEAENKTLREANDKLRENVAKLEVADEGQQAIIDARGGVIANEAKNLEKINESLKTNQAVINAPTDKCVRCRAFSDEALRTGQIGKPLTCKDECAGTNR